MHAVKGHKQHKSRCPRSFFEHELAKAVHCGQHEYAGKVAHKAPAEGIHAEDAYSQRHYRLAQRRMRPFVYAPAVYHLISGAGMIYLVKVHSGVIAGLAYGGSLFVKQGKGIVSRVGGKRGGVKSFAVYRCGYYFNGVFCILIGKEGHLIYAHAGKSGAYAHIPGGYVIAFVEIAVPAVHIAVAEAVCFKQGPVLAVKGVFYFQGAVIGVFALRIGAVADAVVYIKPLKMGGASEIRGYAVSVFRRPVVFRRVDGAEVHKGDNGINNGYAQHYQPVARGKKTLFFGCSPGFFCAFSAFAQGGRAALGLFIRAVHFCLLGAALGIIGIIGIIITVGAVGAVVCARALAFIVSVTFRIGSRLVI